MSQKRFKRILSYITLFIFCFSLSIPTNLFAAGSSLAIYENHKIVLPKDEGLHKSFNTEWWYLNLDLKDSARNNYRGFIAIARSNIQGQEKSVAFLQLSDVITGYSFPNISNGTLKCDKDKLNLTFEGADVNGQKLIINWNTIYTPNWTTKFNSKYKITIESPGINEKLTLIISNVRKPLFEGQDGIVPIGSNTDSYYYSLTNLNVTASISGKASNIFTTNNLTNKRRSSASGKGWFDHQWFNQGQSVNDSKIADTSINNNIRGVSHEWFSIQLSDKSELVLWNIDSSNVTTKYMGVLNSKGIQTDFYSNFEITPLSFWTSPSGKKYANQWSVRGNNIDLIIRTQIPNQTLTIPISKFEFYEGGTIVKGIVNGKKVLGSGFAELTKSYDK